MTFEAEKLIKELKPDVITLDIHMPGMDGVSFLVKIFTFVSYTHCHDFFN